ncbi:hypothetical protein [Bifidobacterium bombi]|nr:hypothetical protein [Bifidobacterium bombi]
MMKVTNIRKAVAMAAATVMAVLGLAMAGPALAAQGNGAAGADDSIVLPANNVYAVSDRSQEYKGKDARLELTVPVDGARKIAQVPLSADSLSKTAVQTSGVVLAEGKDHSFFWIRDDGNLPWWWWLPYVVVGVIVGVLIVLLINYLLRRKDEKEDEDEDEAYDGGDYSKDGQRR